LKQTSPSGPSSGAQLHIVTPFTMLLVRNLVRSSPRLVHKHVLYEHARTQTHAQTLRNTGLLPSSIIQDSSGALRKFTHKNLTPNKMEKANVFTATETKVLCRIKSSGFIYYILFKSIICKRSFTNKKGYKFNWPEIYGFLCLSFKNTRTKRMWMFEGAGRENAYCLWSSPLPLNIFIPKLWKY
jgi:hypothetical protein